MIKISATQARNNFGDLLSRAEAGEEIVILRRGKAVARLVPPRRRRLPSLARFRAAILVKGEPLSRTVLRARNEDWR
ncbi:MAG: type II toxin-antitoxin system prevent-host-death family antitoxin [Armatimonadetes bacterium]|nr:type II toxin-antitoxin system prevent-host-death family antitoxin [Armatimonadota bacterium]